MEASIVKEPLRKGMYAIVNGPHGLSLSERDYERSNTQGLVYRLDRLLMRPGFDALFERIQWRSLGAWGKPVLIDASTLAMDSDMQITVVNDFDGSRRRYSAEQCVALLAKLAVDGICIHPSWEAITQEQTPIPWIIPAALPNSFRFPEGGRSLVFVEEHSQWEAITQSDIAISECPVQDAVAGMVYEGLQPFSIMDTCFEKDYQPLQQDCTCHTCQQGFTRAYLHHLYQHTPLLCYRLLAIHNLSSVQSYCENHQVNA
jgi:queuine tRNA-ribosyltransferase